MKKIPAEGVEMEVNVQVVGDAEAETTFENTQVSHFGDRLTKAIRDKGTPICVGIDPFLAQIPACITDPIMKEHGHTLEAVSKILLDFSLAIIDSVYELVPAVKPQVAFFEQYGFYGMLAYEQVCKYATSKGLIVIADVKRGDIGSTAQAYADFLLGKVDVLGQKKNLLEVDAVTINPYMGYDSVRPFLVTARANGKGAFILAKTSNPSSGDVQDRGVESGFTVYEMVSQLIDVWGADDIGESGYSCVGAVVGATFPKEAKKLRSLMPHQIFLVPGYGAQGASAKDVLSCFNKDGTGAIINSSRAILYAYEADMTTKDGSHFQQASRNAVITMKRELGAM